MGDTPAAVNWTTGELLINPDIWKVLPSDVRDYILLHEEGHWALKTRSELEADRYALEKFVQVGNLDQFGHSLSVLVSLKDMSRTRTLSEKKLEKLKGISGIEPVTIAGLFSIGSKLLGGLFGGSKEDEINAQNEYIRLQNQAKMDQAILAERASKTMYTYILVFIILIIFGIVLYKTF